MDNNKKKGCEIVSNEEFMKSLPHSSMVYTKTCKGKLIQNVLCRWWYAYKWPEPKSIPCNPPQNSDSLDGFPGVFINTSGHNTGRIIDYRNRSKCPSFINFVQKSS